MVVCKPTYEMVFGLSGLTHVILKDSKTIPVISGSIGLNFTVPESTPKDHGEGTHQRSINRPYEWLF